MVNLFKKSKYLFIYIVILTSLFRLNAQSDQPNIIFILVDDLGYGDLGEFYQDQKSGNKFDTPYLDKMAEEGIKITNHYTVPVCAPSRASLLQGLSPGHASVRNNQFDVAIPIDINMPKALQIAGYKTYMVGKHGIAGFGRDNFPSHPLNNGFDDYFGYLNHVAGHEHYPRNGTTNKNAFLYEGKTKITTGTDKTYTTDVFTARAKKNIIDHVQDNPDQPFFMYLAYDVPHSKLQIPTMAYPEGKGVNGGLQWTGADHTNTPYVNTASGTIDSWHYPDVANKSWPGNQKKHVTMIRRLDEAIGDLLITLDDLGIDQNTLVVFTSDNGPHNEGGQNPNFFQSYGELRGIKRDITDGGIRVPVIARWPSTIDPNSVSDHNCGMWSWAATFADLSDAPIPARFDGASLAPILKGKKVENDIPPYIEYFNNSGQRREMQAIRIGDYVGIRTNIENNDTPLEIYNLIDDPKQNNNLVANLPKLEEQMKRQMLRMRIPHRSQERPYDNVLIPDVPIKENGQGINYTTVKGDFGYIPRVDKLTVESSGQLENIDLDVKPSDTNFTIFYEGYLKIPSDGKYTFYLNSDAPAHLMLHDIHVLGSDLTHDTNEISQVLHLEAGYHPIKLYYTHTNQSNFNLNLDYEGPGIVKQSIPNRALYRGERIAEDYTVLIKNVIKHKSSNTQLYADATGKDLKSTRTIDSLNYWGAVPADDGYFYLVHQLSGAKLHSDGNYETVNTADPNWTGNNVQWAIDTIPNDSWFRIRHKASGKWLHLKPDGNSQFQLISTNNRGDNTRWRITEPQFSEGTYRIINRNSGKCLVNNDQGTSNGTRVVQTTSSGSVNENWIISSLANDEYTIQHEATGLYADIESASQETGANNILWSKNGNNNQKWKIIKQKADYYHIVNVNSGLFLDILGASSANNAQNIQWNNNGGFNQDWSFIPVESTTTRITKNFGIQNEQLLNSSEISIYPNPLPHQNLRIDLPSDFTNASLEISEINGKVLLKKEDINGSSLIDTSFLKNGTYLITVKNEIRKVAKRIIINK